MTISRIFFPLLITFMASTASAKEDPREIVNQLLNRNDGTTEAFKLKLITCRYAKKDNQNICAEKPQAKVMETIRKDYGKNEQETKSISIISSPAAEKGVGFLQYDYEDIKKDSDQWMYFSSLRKVKRIVSGNENQPKSGSFFGSEFSYEDMEKNSLNDFNYTLLGTESYQDRSCWVIESRPTTEKAKKSNYSQSTLWIDKERNIILKTELIDRRGQLAKRLTAIEIKKIDGIWTKTVVNMNNLKTKRMSAMIKNNISFNIDVTDGFLTQRTLTDKSFRERNLKVYRQHIDGASTN